MLARHSARRQQEGLIGVSVLPMRLASLSARQQAGCRSVAIDPGLRISNEPRQIQPFPFARLDGQVLPRGRSAAGHGLGRRGRPAAVVHIGALGRRVRAGSQ